MRTRGRSAPTSSGGGYELARVKILAAAGRRRPRRLDLSEYKLRALPSELWQLTELKNLNLDRNELDALPPEIGRLTELEYLHLQGNQLDALPSELWQLGCRL